jgi:hypothetical protein
MSKSLKGGDFERQLSKQLSLWWTNDQRDDVMWRTSQSGGRATQRAKKAVSTRYSYGDISFTDPLAQPLFDLLVISAKRGYTATSKPISSKELDKVVDFVDRDCYSKEAKKKRISKLFSNAKKTGGVGLLEILDKPSKSKQMLQQWIAECTRDCSMSGTTGWWLIFRRDGCESVCVMPTDIHDELAKYLKMTLKQFGCAMIQFQYAHGASFVAAKLQDVLAWCKPYAVFDAAKDAIKFGKRVR